MTADGFENNFYTRMIISTGCASLADYKSNFPHLKAVLCASQEASGYSVKDSNGLSLGAAFGLAFVGAFLGFLLAAFVLLALCCLWCRCGRPLPARGPVHHLASGHGGFSAPQSPVREATPAVENVDTA